MADLRPAEPGSVLFSLLLVSHEVKCEASLFNDIRNGPMLRGRHQSAGPRYFFLGIGFKEETSRDFSKSPDIVNYMQFKLPKRTLDDEFGGKQPKLCLTTQKMTPQTGRNRVKILTFMFNFILNSDQLQRRTPFQLSTSGNQECRSRGNTLEMLTRMYDTSSELYSFSQEVFSGREEAGYLGNKLFAQFKNLNPMFRTKHCEKRSIKEGSSNRGYC